MSALIKLAPVDRMGGDAATQHGHPLPAAIPLTFVLAVNRSTAQRTRSVLAGFVSGWEGDGGVESRGLSRLSSFMKSTNKIKTGFMVLDFYFFYFLVMLVRSFVRLFFNEKLSPEIHLRGPRSQWVR